LVVIPQGSASAVAVVCSPHHHPKTGCPMSRLWDMGFQPPKTTNSPPKNRVKPPNHPNAHKTQQRRGYFYISSWRVSSTQSAKIEIGIKEAPANRRGFSRSQPKINP
jgi:hypothetical protein